MAPQGRKSAKSAGKIPLWVAKRFWVFPSEPYQALGWAGPQPKLWRPFRASPTGQSKKPPRRPANKMVFWENVLWRPSHLNTYARKCFIWKHPGSLDNTSLVNQNSKEAIGATPSPKSGSPKCRNSEKQCRGPQVTTKWRQCS